jgi:6,7-dimethyl-8-ribityllumazine synthase
MAGAGSFDDLSSATCGVPGLREFRGGLNATGLSFALVVSRFHTELTKQLAGDAVNMLTDSGAATEAIEVVWVPGAFEIPSVVRPLARAGRHDALIALGCVVRGETSHADSIVHAVTVGLSEVARESGVPVIDGVVAAPSYELAEQRCRSGANSRGSYTASAAIEMATVLRHLPQAGGV